MESFITTKSLFSEIQHAQEIANEDLVPSCVSEKRQQSLHLTCLSQIFTVWVHQVPHPLIMLAIWLWKTSSSKWVGEPDYSSTHHVGHAHWERCLLRLRGSLFKPKNWSKYFCKLKIKTFFAKLLTENNCHWPNIKTKAQTMHFVHLWVKLPAFTSLAKVSQRIHTISANKINPTPRKHFMISCPTCPPAWSRSWPAPRTASPSTWSGRAQGCCTPRCTLGTAPPSS